MKRELFNQDFQNQKAGSVTTGKFSLVCAQTQFLTCLQASPAERSASSTHPTFCAYGPRLLPSPRTCVCSCLQLFLTVSIVWPFLLRGRSSYLCLLEVDTIASHTCDATQATFLEHPSSSQSIHNEVHVPHARGRICSSGGLGQQC